MVERSSTTVTQESHLETSAIQDTAVIGEKENRIYTLTNGDMLFSTDLLNQDRNKEKDTKKRQCKKRILVDDNGPKQVEYGFIDLVMILLISVMMFVVQVICLLAIKLLEKKEVDQSVISEKNDHPSEIDTDKSTENGQKNSYKIDQNINNITGEYCINKGVGSIKKNDSNGAMSEKKLLFKDERDDNMIGGDENRIAEANEAKRVNNADEPVEMNQGMIGGDQNKIEEANETREKERGGKTGMIGGDQGKIEEANETKKVNDAEKVAEPEQGKIGGDETKIDEANKAIKKNKGETKGCKECLDEHKNAKNKGNVYSGKNEHRYTDSEYKKNKEAMSQKPKEKAERRPTEAEVMAIGNFTPVKLRSPRVDTKVMEYRNNGIVFTEGPMWKRRELCSCM
ncbi:hypothetical protein ECANGB1_1471, partial [Enterospora canceri]